MLDWREITAQIQHAETLSLDDLRVELAELRANSPEIGDEVTRYFARNRRIDSFMNTSAPSFQHKERILPNGSILGVWEIFDLIGSGGMGDVYRARRSDGLYDQEVALKVIQRTDRDSLSRFEEERKRLATLEHPGISRIIDGGETDAGHPYMVMEFVEGKSIDDHVHTEKLTRKQSLSIFKELCASVTHAHSKLILHRDIKTTNVLVDRSGSVKLIDFGIAAVIGETSDGHGGPMTIAYAAPEQLMGKPPTVGSDIFALGVLLHQILTGAPQQRKSDASVEGDRTSIGDEELIAIVSKATAFDQDARYQSVTAFADDIDAYLDNRPVVARNGTGTYRFRKLVQRNALASTLALGFALALSGGMITSLFMANKATQETARANKELIQSEWNLRQASVNSVINSARADAFQYVFGLEADQQALSSRLEEYLGDITEGEKANNPQIAAAKSYVVGKHFLSRNDYVTARQAFEPWIEEGHGSEHLRAFGQTSLGFAYQQLGEPELALKMFQNSEKFYVGTPLENTIEHAATAIQIALLSDDAVETDRARNIIKTVLEIDEGPYNRLYLIGRIYKIERKHGNWEAAYDALEQQIGMIESGHLGEIASSDTSHINFAFMNFYHKQDYALAMQHVQIAQSIADTKKGKSGTIGHILTLRAMQDWMNKDYETALKNISEAQSVFEEYSGRSQYFIGALAFNGIIQADAGNYEAASKILERLKTELTDKSGTWSDLLQVYIVAREEGIQSAQKLYDNPNTDKRSMLGKLNQGFYLTVLKEDGLKL